MAPGIRQSKGQAGAQQSTDPSTQSADSRDIVSALSFVAREEGCYDTNPYWLDWRISSNGGSPGSASGTLMRDAKVKA